MAAAAAAIALLAALAVSASSAAAYQVGENFFAGSGRVLFLGQAYPVARRSHNFLMRAGRSSAQADDDYVLPLLGARQQRHSFDFMARNGKRSDFDFMARNGKRGDFDFMARNGKKRSDFDFMARNGRSQVDFLGELRPLEVHNDIVFCRQDG